LKQVDARILENSRIATGMYLMRLNAPDITARAKPGQFVMVQCGDDTILRRPLSVHLIDGTELALLYALRGKGTAWLSQQKIGETINIFGTMGNGFTLDSQAKQLVLVAGGIGIAPLFYLAQTAVRRKKTAILLMGAATAKQLYPPGLLPPGIEVTIATDDGSSGHAGLVTDLLPDHAVAGGQIVACGPLPMYRFMAPNQKRLGIAHRPVQVSMEMRMGCGVGICYGCTIRTKSGLKQACKDGPVFNLDDIVWDELAHI
jgi:dihydroorotate dehydrogenase electron transfer subunit